MRAAFAFAMLPSQMGSTLLGLFGGLGISLAMVGLFGVISFAVSRRTGGDRDPHGARRLAR